MCGITGIFAYQESAPPVDQKELLSIREAMIHRGPDGAGLWISPDQRVGLAHRRLAIIDLSDAGAQPMATNDGKLLITFNGEIYNYRELRKELEAKGFRFFSNSDTEVLLHLYADRGAEMVHALRGMYAFGIWDERKNELFLARDPLGIKPLYYADNGRTFRFASLVEALIKGGQVDTAENLAGIGGFYLFGSVPDPFTFYRAVHSLPAGTTLRVGLRGIDGPKPYFSLTEEFLKAEAAPSTLSFNESQDQIREVLQDSMRHHMVSDVPLGIFLSAGVDSSVLAALGSENSAEKLHAITLGFREFEGGREDETVIAAATAKGLGIQQSTVWINKNSFRDDWNHFLSMMDQATVDGVNSYLVSKVTAASKIKVAISGLGGDELFGGYPSFREIPLLQRNLPQMPALGKAIRILSEPVLRQFTSPKYAGLFEYGSSYAGAYILRKALYMPWELPRLLGADRALAAMTALQPMERLQKSIHGLKNPRCIVSALELSWYMRHQLLRDSDWAGMAHGVEIRVPLVDISLIRAIAPLIAGSHPPNKSHLIGSVRHLLDPKIIMRKKTGFSVPVRSWLREDAANFRTLRGLRGWAQEIGRRKSKRRFVSFITDAFGGYGGIALYNRDLLKAICSSPSIAGGVAFPRLIPNRPEPIPDNLSFILSAAHGKARFVKAVTGYFWSDHNFDVVICAHINLIPLAYLVSRLLKLPLILVIFGIEAWQPTGSVLTNALAKRVKCVISISDVTAKRFISWAGVHPRHVTLLPNAIHTEWYGPGVKNPALLRRYGLAEKTVLMTLGRLVSAERYKGFDEVLEMLPGLIEKIPNAAYLIVGDGSDANRLQAKADALGIRDRVVFAGLIPEEEKADHYRLADAYLMPSHGEGFGFVLLEAMACGIPVVASKLDGGREAIRDGQLGILVDPGKPEELKQAVLDALEKQSGIVPAGLEYFSFSNFESRTHALINQLMPDDRNPFS